MWLYSVVKKNYVEILISTLWKYCFKWKSSIKSINSVKESNKLLAVLSKIKYFMQKLFTVVLDIV